MSKGKPYEVRSVILCDDARQEINGKEILIGVYNDAIVVQSLPLHLTSIVFRVALRFVDPGLRKFKFAVRTPDGQNILDFSGELPSGDNDDDPKIIGLKFQNFPLASAGIYQILLGIEEEPKQIWDFIVRLPMDEKEIARFR